MCPCRGIWQAFVNISVIAQYFRDRATTPRNPLTWIVAPLIGLGFVGWLLTHLDSNALTLGLIWLGLGLCWLFYLTRGFRVPPPAIGLEDSAERDEDAPQAKPAH